MDYPSPLTPPDGVAPVPRRIRAVLGGATVFDTTRATYVWEFPPYPQYYVPLDDVAPGVLEPEGTVEDSPKGKAELHTVTAGGVRRPGAAKVPTESDTKGLAGTVRFEWSALDAWFEEDERVFVHPRNPYARVDALRSTRHVRVEKDGVLLADTTSPVLVFETGLPTRYYINRTDVDFTHLVPSDTVTACPYKGTTSGYWSVKVGDRLHRDLAWTYDFPTRQLLPIAGLIAFYNEKVDLTVNGD
jgi:uncharacterized protein (DUF427 family)